MDKRQKKAIVALIIIILLIIIVVLIAGCAVTRRSAGASDSAGAADSSAVVGGPAGVPGDAVASGALSVRYLELPAGGNDGLTHFAQMGGRQQRNYTMLYDPSVFASYWVAYPLCADHLGTGRTETWAYDPKIDQAQQTKVSSGSYGVNLSAEETTYSSNYYARGHQIPNADRNGVDEMMAQTYYSTNMTPQIQNGFNGGIWAKLEAGVRAMVPQGDTLYIVTGAAFRKVGGDEAVKQIVSTRDGKTLPVPNYYWKAVLKVKRGADGQIVDAQTLGFWLPHKEVKKGTYAEYTTSVDQIETWTGFDLFPALPDSFEESAEANSSLETFLAW